MVASYAARGKGNKPQPAIAPSITALTMVPLLRAISPMSNTWCSRLWARTISSSVALSVRPSLICMRSCVVKLRLLALMTRVRAAALMLLPIWRVVSSNSDDTSASRLPGTGYRLSTGRLPPSSLSGTGNTST